MFRTTGLATVLFLAWASTARAVDPAPAKVAPYVHVVIFHLTKDVPAATAEALIADCHAMLAKVESVRGIQVGKPAEQATPDLAKKDYQVGLLVLFDDYNGLKTYLEHPLHLKFVERHGKYIDRDKLQVFDFSSN